MDRSCINCKLSYWTSNEVAEHIDKLMCERGDYEVDEFEACVCDHFDEDVDPAEVYGGELIG
ncbi:MAG: hypothetical protein RR817_11020 [Niameybacter sp.]